MTKRQQHVTKKFPIGEKHLVNFKREKNGLLQKKHEQDPHIFTKANIGEIGQEYDKYVEWVMGQVSAWNKKD